MAYRIGQIRNNSITSSNIIGNRILVSSTTAQSSNPFTIEQTDYFDDFGYEISSSSSENTFSSDKVYYFCFQIKAIPSGFYSGLANTSEELFTLTENDSLDISLRLVRSTSIGDEANFQTLGSFKVPSYTFSQEEEGVTKIHNILCHVDNKDTTIDTIYVIPYKYITYSLVFHPMDNSYKVIKFTQNRTAIDALVENNYRKWLISPTNGGDLSINNSPRYGPVGTISSGDYANYHLYRRKIDNNEGIDYFIFKDEDDQDKNTVRLVNLYSLQNLVSSAPWKKIGYQGRPGDILVINKQAIRVGRSGIYELDNGTDIDQFMLAPPGGQPNTFILDYVYTTS